MKALFLCQLIHSHSSNPHYNSSMPRRTSPAQRQQRLNDPVRLEVLKKTRLLDTITEEAYDRFTKLAAILLETPVSLVSLVDKDRQFFKSFVGLPAEVASQRQTPLSHSFCQYVVAAGEPLIVSDARDDDILKANLATIEMGVIAYLGFPLVVENQPMGSLCVIDSKPRTWTEREITIVKELAAFVTTEIALQMRNAEQAKIEEKLRESNERLRLALQAGNIGVWDWNIITNELTWTERVYQIHGVTRDTFNLSYDAFSALIHPEDKKRAKTAINDALEGNKEFAINFRVITPQGKTRWIATSATVIRNEQLKPVRMLGAMSDISQQKKLEQNKNEFIGIASHELKTPVTSIKAYAQILHNRFKKSEDYKSAEITGKMNVQLDKLTALISDLLDVTKIESGKLQFKKVPFDINELITRIVEDMQLTTDKQTIIVDLENSKVVEGDADRIGQVLINLLSNAIKYAPTSEVINVTSTITKDSIIIRVQDYGIGLTDESRGKIFQRFFRVEGDNQNTYPGLGLGLYISHEIIKRHNGKMWVESQENQGSSFFVELPIAQS